MTDVAGTGSNTPDTPVSTGTDAAQAIQNSIQKLKIDWENGNAEELSPEDLISNYKLTKRQAEQLQSQMDPVMQFLAGLQKGDLDSLSNLNIPEDRMLDFAEKILTKKLEFEQMSPAERAFLQKEKDLAEKERQYRQWETEQQTARQEQLNKQALGQVQDDIVEAMKDLGLKSKPSPRLIRRVAEQLKAQLEAQKPMDAKRASRHEWQNIQDELRDFQLAALEADPEKFVEGLPKEIRKAIRDYEIKAGTPFKRAESNAPGGSEGGPLRDWDYLEKTYAEKPKRRAK